MVPTIERISAVLATAPQTARLANLIAAEEQAGVPPDPLRRLAALSVYVSDDGTRLAARLRLARDERERLENMGRARQILLSSPKTIREALYRLGSEHFMDLAIIKAATERRPDLAREWIDCARSWSIPTFPVSGSDLLSRGMSPGPELGQRLGSLEEEWIASDFALSQSQLLASLKPVNAERKNTE